MRKVPLLMLTPDMRLGRAVCQGNNVLIREGTKDLNKYINRLARLGIESVLIEDDVCEGIEVVDILQDKTRRRCKQTLKSSFARIESHLAVDHNEITSTIESLLEEVIANSEVLVNLSEIGDIQDNTLDHSINTTVYALCFASAKGYGKDKMAELAYGTLMHDIGKTMINSKILFKPGRLTTEEFLYIQTHTTLGYDLLKKNHNIAEPSRQIALCHHERLDGTGYPNGLGGSDIPEFCKIAAIVDVYEALTVDRCYHKAVTPQRALEILSEEAISKLDFSLTGEFMQHVAVYPNGSHVLLSDGSCGIIKSQNYSLPMRPIVRKIDIKDGKQQPGEEIDLMEILNVTIIESDVTKISEFFSSS